MSNKPRNFTCQNPACMKNSESKEGYAVCSGCKTASYCSRDCQKAHWKLHKSRCLANQEAFAKSANDVKDVDGYNIVMTKLLEDLRKWTKRNSDWLMACYYNAVELGSNPEIHRTHCAVIQLSPHNTMQGTYRFTFKDAFKAEFKELEDSIAEKGQSENLEKARSAVIPSQDGKPVLTAVAVIFCGPAVFVKPMGLVQEALSVMNEYPDWKERLGVMLKAPSGVKEAKMLEELAAWFNKQRRAMVFCCVNYFKLKDKPEPPSEILEFDTMYSEKGEGDDRTYRFSLLLPAPITWPDFEQRVLKMNNGPELLQWLGSVRTITVNNSGESGVPCIVFPSVVGAIPIAAPYFITTKEIEDIEYRDDWRTHMYTMLDE